MSIERVIHGSLPLGIESDTPGYQEFTYTKGYKAMIESNQGLDRKLTTSYKPPETYGYYEWLGNTENLVQDKNKASALAREEHPASFKYFLEEIDGALRPVFVFAKDMGISWDGGRPGASYHSAVICETSDIKKYPVMYCSSPVVCCDIPRDSFFPDDKSKLNTPAFLGQLSSLDSENDVKLKHSAGFEKITVEKIIDFIHEEENLSILKSMISSLILLKSGNEKCRVVVADKKEHIILWIAALSYVFPFECTFDLSFSSYDYKIRDFDINGVFVPELNNCDTTDDFAVTDYDFAQAQSSYSVYDFKEYSFAPDVEVYNNLFMSLIENAFTINEQILEQYKKYIIDFTTYRKIDARYMDGAVLFMFMTKNKQLSASQMETALAFAKEFSTRGEKKNVLLKTMQVYKGFLSNSSAIEAIIEYIRYCVLENIISQSQIEKVFMSDVKKSFLDYENTSFDTFCEQGNIAEKFCGFSYGLMEVAFVNAVGLETLLSLIDSLYARKDVQRIFYIHTAIAHYVNDGKGSFKYGTREQKIVSKITDIFVTGETDNDIKRLDALTGKVNQIITDIESTFLYLDTVYQTLNSRGYKQLAKKVVANVAEMYLPSKEEKRKYLVSSIYAYGKAETYLPFILEEVKNYSDPYERIYILTEAVINNSKEFSTYTAQIRKLAFVADDASVNSDFYYKIFLFLKTCSKTYYTSISDTEIANLLAYYMKHLRSEHEDFNISKEKASELKTLNHEYEATRKDGKSVNIVCAFLLIQEMQNCITNKGKCVFNGNNPNPLVDYSKLKAMDQQILIESMSKLIAEYWLNTENLPVFQKMFVVSEKTEQVKVYSYVFGEILECVINSNSKNRSVIMVDIIEYAIYLKLFPFLDDVPEMLIYKVKQNEILKPLENDLETKPHLQDKSSLLAVIDTSELQQQINRIKEAYKEKAQNSPLGKAKKAAKQVLGNFVNGLRNGKKEDQ